MMPPVVCSPGTFRLFLSLLVVADHFTGVMIGRSAVFLFFALSGFWIQKMWVDRYSHCEQPYLTFVISRVWRLMPIMLAATALSAWVRVAALGDPLASLWRDGVFHTVASHLFLIGYADLNEPRLVTPAWSLDIEMQFYLIAPILAILLIRLRWLAFGLLCAALVAFDVMTGAPMALQHVGWFAVGMIGAKLGVPPPRSLVIASLAAVAGIVALVLVVEPSLLVDRNLNDSNRSLNQVLALLAIPVALSTCFQTEYAGTREQGNLSYVVYLIHWPLLICAQSAKAVHWLAPAIPAALILPVSIALWRWLDAPLQRARSRWVSGRVRRQVEPSEPQAIAALSALN